MFATISKPCNKQRPTTIRPHCHVSLVTKLCFAAQHQGASTINEDSLLDSLDSLRAHGKHFWHEIRKYSVIAQLTMHKAKKTEVEEIFQRLNPLLRAPSNPPHTREKSNRRRRRVALVAFTSHMRRKWIRERKSRFSFPNSHLLYSMPTLFSNLCVIRGFSPYHTRTPEKKVFLFFLLGRYRQCFEFFDR